MYSFLGSGTPKIKNWWTEEFGGSSDLVVKNPGDPKSSKWIIPFLDGRTNMN